ncbi:hypothetical protein Tco_0044531 [Tanacetum coccineum]
MDVEDVLTHPEENVVAQLLTDEEIIESVIGINKDDIDEEDDESSTMEPPSRNEAIKAAITLNNFLLSYEKTFDFVSRYGFVTLLDYETQDDDNGDDDYDEESILSMNTNMFETPSPNSITTSSSIEEPKDSLIMEDEDINTIPEKESDEENESSVENLFHIPSESKVTSDNESECDLPIFDDASLDVFEDNCVLFSKPLFNSYGDSTSSEYSSDNESFLAEDVFSNLPFEFDIESISSDMNPIYDEVLEDIDGTNYLIDSIIDFSSKIDPLFEEFAGELALINPIPLGIAGAEFDPEGDIRLVEKLLNDNSSHRTPDELNSKDIIEFFSTFPIPVEDSDSLLEETNTILSYLDDSLPELETFSFDVKEKNSGSTTTHADISLPKNDSYHIDLSDTSLHLADKSDSVFEKFDDELAHIIPPPEYDCFYFDIEPDLGDLTTDMMKIFSDNSTREKSRVHIPNVLPTIPTLYLDLDFTLSYDFSGLNLVASFPSGNGNKTFDLGISIEVQSKRFLSLNTYSILFISDPLSPVLETLLPFSSENEDKVFNLEILVSKEEKSPHLLSHRGFKAFKIIHNFLNESPMMIYEGDMPILDVPYLHFYPP